MKGWFILNVVIGQSSSIFKLFSGKYKTVVVTISNWVSWQNCVLLGNSVRAEGHPLGVQCLLRQKFVTYQFDTWYRSFINACYAKNLSLTPIFRKNFLKRRLRRRFPALRAGNLAIEPPLRPKSCNSNSPLRNFRKVLPAPGKYRGHP